jgi:hypothetical protein
MPPLKKKPDPVGQAVMHSLLGCVLKPLILLGICAAGIGVQWLSGGRIEGTWAAIIGGTFALALFLGGAYLYDKKWTKTASKDPD